jgi:glycosyltransferase involved in cell wall biosynthesis
MQPGAPLRRPRASACDFLRGPRFRGHSELWSVVADVVIHRAGVGVDAAGAGRSGGDSLMSKISIVTASRNQGVFLDEMLNSVRLQNYANMEHIVLDGESTDDTLAFLEAKTGPEWQHLHWTSERDDGQTQAMNKGLRLATGDIIGWLNSDDRYRPGCFATVAKVFAQNPDVDILYGDYTLIDETGAHLRTRRETNFSRLVLFYHRCLCIPTTSCFFRRRIFDEGNRLDERLHYAMDFEFFVRLAAQRYRFKHVPAILADFRFQEGSKTCTASHKQLEELDSVMHLYSPLLRKIQKPTSRRITTSVLRSCACVLRYSEKLMRGYYFDQYRPPTLAF